MKSRPSENHRPRLVAGIQSWIVSGRSKPSQDIMAGSGTAQLFPMPYLMSSPGTWAPGSGGPQDIMAGRP